MSRIDLDRAFEKTPDCIHSAIEMGIRKGKIKMKLQKKIITLASAAAGLAITIAVAALAAGGFDASPVPDLLVQPQASQDNLQTPEPVLREEATVYFTEQGHYFHFDEHCSGMMYAKPHLIQEALEMGKDACPVCMPDGIDSDPPMQAEESNPELVSSSDMPFFPKEAPVYLTENGIYAHYDSICCSISGAQPCAYADAHALGYISCPVCGPNPRETVYATENGKYYHCVENCSGMQRALAITPVEAQWEGKWACPVCMVPYVYELEMEGSIRSSAYLQRLIPDTNSGLALNDFVYTALGENCFHLDVDCSNSPKEHETLELAIARNQLPCPECIGSLPKDYDLFETAFGKDIHELWENWEYSHCYLNDLSASHYSWLLTNGRETGPGCDVYERGDTPEAQDLQMDVHFLNQKDSRRFLESVRREPFSHIYPLAMEMAQQHLQDEGQHEEPEQLYVQNLILLFDEKRQLSNCILCFSHEQEDFQISAKILENGDIETRVEVI